MGTAWAAGAESTGHGGFFAEPESWVAIAFVLFVVLLGRILWAKSTALLDKRSAAIAKALADAVRLREEAARAKAEAELTLTQATSEAEAIIGLAREEVQRTQARAAASLDNAVALREQQALDRIAQAEAAATKQVRDTAVDVALGATRSLLREQVGARAETEIDQAIAELPRRLH